jgi:Resolvase, N terminal domain/ChrR Cupin-like domain
LCQGVRREGIRCAIRPGRAGEGHATDRGWRSAPRLDRLARSTRDLLNILHQLAEKGAKFKSLHDPWCDTSTPQGELLVTILAGFATFERHLIKARTDDGRKRAQDRGVRFGRPPTALFKLDPGAVVPLHEHAALEQTYVIEGTLEDHEGGCGPGQFVWRPAGNQHEAVAPNGAVLLGFFLKPNRFAHGERFFTEKGER